MKLWARKGCLGCGGILLSGHCAIFWMFVSAMLSFLAMNWQETTCLVQQITNYKLETTSGNSEDSSVTATEYYTRLNVLVNISGVWLPSFACGYGGAYQLGDYSSCRDANICGKELMLPDWSCSSCEVCDELLTGLPQPCHWSYHSAGVSKGPEKWPAGFRPLYPTNGMDFVHVALIEEVNWGVVSIGVIGVSGGFIVLLTVCLGICTYTLIRN